MYPLGHVGLPMGIAYALSARWPALARIDYRWLAAGALLPDALDKLVLGLLGIAASKGPGHALLLSLALLAMGLALRARTLGPLALGAGALSHQLLDQPWGWTRAFLSPLLGPAWVAFDAEASLAGGLSPVVLAGEVAGVALLAWVAWRARLDAAERRRAFLRTGRLPLPGPRRAEVLPRRGPSR